MAHPKHQAVRKRYQYRCGYCGVSETDTGGELTIDHYHPVSAGGDDSDDNLVYTCYRCNLYKSDIQMDPALPESEFRILHPLLDSTTAHLLLNVLTGKLEPLTDRGRFHLVTLRLNRAELIAHRQQKRMVELLRVRMDVYEQEIAQLRQEILVQSELLVRLSEQQRQITDTEENP